MEFMLLDPDLLNGMIVFAGIFKKIAKEIGRGAKRIGKEFKRSGSKVVKETKRFAKSDVGKVAIGAAALYFGGPAALKAAKAAGTAWGGLSTGTKIATAAAATQAAGTVYGGYQQNKAIKQAEEQAAQEAAEFNRLMAEANKEEPAMPTPSGEEVQRARRRSMAQQRRRRGRASTIMSDAARQPLGGA